MNIYRASTTLKMLEFYGNSTDNLFLTIVLEFWFNNLLSIFLPKKTTKYHCAVVFQYFAVVLDKNNNIKLLNRNSTSMVKIRFSCDKI